MASFQIIGLSGDEPGPHRINYCTMHDIRSHHAGIWARLIWQDQSGGTILEPGAAVALHELQNINAWWENIGFLSLCAQWHRCFIQALLFIYCLIVQILDIDFLNLYCGFNLLTEQLLFVHASAKQLSKFTNVWHVRE